MLEASVCVRVLRRSDCGVCAFVADAVGLVASSFRVEANERVRLLRLKGLAVCVSSSLS